MRLQSSSRHHSRFPTSLVSVMRVFFPALLLFWLFFFTYAKPAPTHQLRGSQHFELPPIPYGDKSQTLIRKATTEVRRKIIAPSHAIIVAGHAVVRLNKMSSAGAISLLAYRKIHQQMINRQFDFCLTSHNNLAIDKAVQFLLPYWQHKNS